MRLRNGTGGHRTAGTGNVRCGLVASALANFMNQTFTLRTYRKLRDRVLFKAAIK